LLPASQASSLVFLSCLYGSEQDVRNKSRAGCFLSCLYGSEQCGVERRQRHFFLSCLYGSELKTKILNPLFIKT
ncbi:hypothetical protein, partial [Cronobacter sakazakii]